MKLFFVALTASTALMSGAFAMSIELPEHVMLSSGQTLAEDQTYTWRAGDDWGSIDPGLSQDSIGFDAIRQMFEGLYSQDEKGDIVPALVQGVEISDDRMIYVFSLRKDGKWSDGKPVTAHDFEYAWKRVANPQTASEYASYIKLMSLKNAGDVIDGNMPVDALGVKAVDAHTLKVELSKPIPYFLMMLAHGTTYPVPRWAIEEHGDKWTNPKNIVVNGAYKLTEFRPGETAIFERNEIYRDNDNVIIDKAIQLTITDENQGYNRFLAGELDWTHVPTGQYPRLKKEMPDVTYSTPILCSYYLSMNQSENGPDYLKDPRIRRALSLVIDREMLVEKVTQAGQIPAYTFTPQATAGFTVPYLPYYTESTQVQKDIEARELLEEAGYGPDNPLTVDYIYNTSEGHKKVAIFISQMWKEKLGVETNINNMEWKTLLDTRNQQDYEIARDGWCADYNEASTFVEVFTSKSSYNSGKYKNIAVDSMMEDSKTQSDPQTHYTIIEGYLAEDTAFIPIYHYTAPRLIDSDVGGYPFLNAQETWFIKNLYKVDVE